MSEQDKINRHLKSIFYSPEAGGRSAEEINNSTLSPKQLRQLAEKLALQDVGRSCFICGLQFDSEGVLNSIVLGPIGSHKSSAIAHKDCYEQRLAEHPEIGSSLGKSWDEYSSEERQRWKKAFSSVEPDSFFGKLFNRK